MATASTESSLLAKLEASDSTPIYSLFADYLRPFSDLQNDNTKPNPKSKPKAKPNQNLIRPLAKKFLTFLNNSITILPKRLSNLQCKDDHQTLVDELYDTYRLCLNCLELISSQLACKPYTIQLQRVRFVCCLVASGKGEDAVREGLRVLETLRRMDFEGKCGDSEFGKVFVEAVAAIVQCAAVGRSKDCEVYRRVLGLFQEAKCWFRVLDANAYAKLHRVLVSYLGKCTQHLVEEIMCFNRDLVREFCEATLTEYAKSSMKDQFYKFCRRLCFTLFSLQESKPSLIIEIILCVLDSIACQCKVESDNTGIELVELVSYCANKCRTAGTIFCSTVAGHLNHIGGHFPQVITPVDLILRLYATGLYLTNYEVKFRGGDLTSTRAAKDEFVLSCLPDDGDQLHNLASLLSALGSYFSFCCAKNFVSSSVECEDSISQLHLQPDSESSITSMQKNREAYMLSYLNALKFLCFPLAEQVNLEKKELVSEIEAAYISPQLCSIQDAFYQFFDVFFSQSLASERKRDGLDDNKRILSVTVAAFILSITMDCKLKKTVLLIKHIIANEWIQPEGLKYLYASLYNIGVLLYRNKQVKEASKALKLCCRAAWACVARLSQMFACNCNSDGFHGGMTEGAIVDFVNEACTRSAFLLDVLHHRGSQKMEKVIVDSLENWSIAAILFKTLPGPLPLVKQWVKIECKRRKNLDVEDDAPTLYYLLSSSGKASERTIGIILEQNDISGDMSQHETLHCHQLAVAYCLRALCTQEAEPNSKQVIEDIGAALNLWLSVSICFESERCNMVSENTMLLLYNVVDLLSLKGFIEFHNNIYKLMLRLFKCKNVPLEKYLSILWESRRLSHALCISPVNDAFLVNLAEQCGELSKSIEFWMGCLRGSQPLLVGFQQSLLFLFANSSHGCYISKSSVQPCITIHDVKEAASELISSVPVTPRSVFLVGYLYYDLCERLIANGRLLEALSYAKEAHRLRTQLFQEKFSYSVENSVKEYNDAGDISQKLHSSPKGFKPSSSVASEVWSFDASSWNVDGCYLSPWNVLQCYLESVLQVGIIHELVGNGVEAEAFLLWGKSISCTQSLPQFIVAFSSILGKLYRKKQLWDQAEKELKNAKQILVEKSINLSCLKCRLILEVTVDQQLGDLSRSYSGCDDRGNTLIERLSNAEKLYKSALDKLNLSEWKNSISLPEEARSESILPKKPSIQNVEHGAGNTFVHSTLHQPDTVELTARNQLSSKVGGTKCRKTKNALKSLVNDQNLDLDPNSRITRSKYRSSQNQSVNNCVEERSGVSKHAKNNNLSDLPDILSQGKSVLEAKSFVDTAYQAACICNKMKCWQCLPGEVIESGLLDNLLHVKWEFTRRRLSLRVLAGIGKCFGNRDQTHEAHKIVVQSVSVLLCRNSFSHTDSSLPLTVLLDLIGKEYSEDVFAVERAGVLYNLCWFSLKGYRSMKSRSEEYAFVNEMLPLPNTGKGRWKISPESIKDLEQFVKDFLLSLPCTTVICVTLLGGAYTSLLQELLPLPSCVHAWMMLSRFNSINQPIVVLLPVNAVLQEDADYDDDGAITSFRELREIKDCGKNWHCPWGSTIADDVAPAFKLIMEDNYLSSRSSYGDSLGQRSLWWNRRTNLDQRLCEFLRKLEDSWLGPWKYMLLGEWSNCKNLDTVHKKLVRDLKCKCKANINESLLRIVLGGLKGAFKGEECIAQLCFKKGCYVGTVGYSDNSSCGTSSEASNGVERLSELALQLIHEAVDELEEDSGHREPTILVLDCEVQMLPWENIPILRNHEVYRMPSVGSIAATLERIHRHEQLVKGLLATFPLIDPLDAFYLLNPSGDLSETQLLFEDWFRDQNLVGKAGSAPTAEELTLALKSHDLFIYLGHGSGSQYISRHDLLKLEKCAATFLMGCSSGSLSLNGCYIPQGTPLSYLLAGSPVIVANLWDVTDKDIDRFGKTMLDAWLRERSSVPVGCDQCSSVQDEAKNGRGKVNKKRMSRKKLPETSDISLCNNGCDHRPKLGSFMGQAREACKLPFLIGAAPVCYGVPTGLSNTDSVQLNYVNFRVPYGFVYNTYYFLARMIGILENQVKWDDILHLGEFGSFLKMFKWDDNCQ
ncbi:Separase [Citrus sinensis]|uniref:Separase n=1 Tax=Citrus sinensis TaxID=2711 RepID=A0ACB8KC47_CITSI|nr:Separase [Citrus sinensis]